MILSLLNQRRRAAGVAQVVDHLFSNLPALGSIPSNEKQERERWRERGREVQCWTGAGFERESGRVLA
jgi:hypothetical protein